jgi:cytochrome c peroxidase
MLFASCALVAVAAFAWSKDEDQSWLHFPLGMESPAAPQANPLTKAKVDLGRLLYFDKRLSKDSTVSCATCHNPKMGWTDQSPVSTGVGGQKGARNAPTVLNAAYLDMQFWDGRAPSLEEQAKGPIQNPIEMGFTHQGVVDRLSRIKGYDAFFTAAFGDKTVTIDRVAQAIASFERTAVTGDSPFDRYQAGDAKALTPEQQAGMTLFFGKANCSVCHTGKNFTDGDFHNIGVGMSAKTVDLGRFVVSKIDRDRGAFKTPTLRNLSDTFPYMHDGSAKTLEDVVDFYDKGGEKNQWLDSDIHPLGLTAKEKKDLVAFLKSLDGEKVAVDEPQALPQ